MVNTLSSETNNSNQSKTLHVIGIGLPRTGTTSLHAALEILGFAPSHHMCHLYADPNRTEQFIRAFNGEQIDFGKLMKGYASASGPPLSEFYAEIRQINPDVKVILTVRDDAVKWFQSIQDTITSNRRGKFYTFCIYPIRSLRLQNILAKQIVENLKKEYGEFSPLIHDEYKKRVIKQIPKENLLVFNVKNGWKPLCEFLQVDIPDGKEFPKRNEGKIYNQRTQQSIIRGLTSWMFITAFTIFFIFYILFCI